MEQRLAVNCQRLNRRLVYQKLIVVVFLGCAVVLLGSAVVVDISRLLAGEPVGTNSSGTDDIATQTAGAQQATGCSDNMIELPLADPAQRL